jgi:hypothetical protein
VPLGGRGHRTRATSLALSERDHILRAAADRYCVGMSDRQAALVLHARLARYREGAWRRDRIEVSDVTSRHHLPNLDALTRFAGGSERKKRSVKSFLSAILNGSPGLKSYGRATKSRRSGANACERLRTDIAEMQM